MIRYVPGEINDQYQKLLTQYHKYNAKILEESKTLIKTAGKKIIKICPTESDFQYYRARAVSAGNVIEHKDGTCELVPFETYKNNLSKYSKLCRNANDNGDFFSHEELLANYKTFIGKSIFVDHNNENVEDARGIILDAIYNPNRYFVEILFAIDKKAFPQLNNALSNRMITGVSMCCRVDGSVCSICGNNAVTEDDLCEHVINYKGMTIPVNGEMLPVMEYNIHPQFFEESLVTCPADSAAKIMQKVASKSSISEIKEVTLKEKTNIIKQEKNQRFASERIASMEDKLKDLPWS